MRFQMSQAAETAAAAAIAAAQTQITVPQVSVRAPSAAVELADNLASLVSLPPPEDSGKLAMILDAFGAVGAAQASGDAAAIDAALAAWRAASARAFFGGAVNDSGRLRVVSFGGQPVGLPEGSYCQVSLALAGVLPPEVTATAIARAAADESPAAKLAYSKGWTLLRGWLPEGEQGAVPVGPPASARRGPAKARRLADALDMLQ